jgi:hypothetical protein
VTREETARIMAVLGAAFPSATITADTVEVYHATLDDLTYQTVSAVIPGIIRSADWFPTVAAIRRAVAEHVGALSPSSLDAWSEVMSEARRVGNYDSPTFSHDAIRQTVHAIGWANICFSEMPDTVRAHFLRLYDEHRKTADHRAVAGSLGTTERKEITP